MKIPSLAFVALFSLFSTIAVANEKVDVCVRYRADYGWSKGYSVQATVISGSDLNSAVGSINRFKPFSTYAVVFWNQGEASILELPPGSFGSVPIFDSEVEDQNGRKWKIKEGHSLCY